MRPWLRKICLALVADHRTDTILLYGSYADGSAGSDSDVDIAAFAAVPEPVRDARLVDGIYLDAFVYPHAVLLTPTEEHMRLRGSKIVLQRQAEARDFLDRLEHIHRLGPRPLPMDEIAARKVWATKMVTRIARGDDEGNYRRVWLLWALLEDYFHLRGQWYQGPKKALRWLAEFDAPAHRAFCVALAPGASNEAILALASLVTATTA